MTDYKFRLLDYQHRMFASTRKVNAMIGGTGSGKTYLAPRLLFMKMHQYPGNEWIISAPTYGMLSRNPVKYMLNMLKELDFREVSRHKDITDKTFRYCRDEFRFSNGVVYCIAESDPSRMMGIHAKGIFGDEAGLYSEEWYNTALQRLSFCAGQLYLFTTWYTINWLDSSVWKSWENGDPDFLVENPTSYANPYYDIKEIERAKRTLPTNRFNLMYLAQRPRQGDNQLFSVAELQDVYNIPYDTLPTDEGRQLAVTVDVAREGADLSIALPWLNYYAREDMALVKEKNTITELAGLIINRVPEWRKMAATAWGIKDWQSPDTEPRIIIDGEGMGYGVYDMLVDAGLNCVLFRGSESPQALINARMYHNKRTESYFECEKAVRNRSTRLPNNSDMEKDLSFIKYKFDNTGRYLLYSKEILKSELGRSPDWGDVVTMRFTPGLECGVLV